ncbi:hypothetical protein [Lacticaseibacillus absianus]|uniref:hypothetical protein n=1 Tax=Lacticaseibacillus absianus TaxID=2729623 RepID=UPI0015CD246B|nr:hypothetical protein [Lacticaseibacillus absianus]
MKQGMQMLHGEVFIVNGKGANQIITRVFSDDEVAAIRMIVRDEIERHEDETAKFIDESHKAGFDPFNGI